MREFKDILAELLTELGVTQTEFARKAGFKQSQVCEWLKGKAKTGYDSLRQICINLDVSPEFLLGIEEY